ncbi:MAG: AMP-binding protein, partial [Desulfobacteraceae bacterium]
MMTTDTPLGGHDADIEALIRKLVAGPAKPERHFIVGGERFSDLYDMACRIRTWLAAQATPGKPICLCSENRALVTATALAALASGPAVILPYAQSEQALEETRQAIDFDVAVVDGPRALPAGVSSLDRQAIAETQPDPRMMRPGNPDDQWIFLFTGGSTGVPKIWTKTPCNLLGESAFLVREFNVTDADVILATVPPYHIYGLLYSVLVPLLASARVCRQTPTFPNEILTLAGQTDATILISIPAHYRALRNHHTDRHNLRIAFSSGGALAPEDDQAFFESVRVPVTEVYGSTETGGIALRCRAAGRPGLIPYSCVDWRIADDALCVRSRFLSRELETDSAGFYRTADRAKPDGDQGFALLGRSDGIVKVAGKRVDLLSIQQVLQKIPGVDDAYVFAKKTEQGRENVILALVAGDAAEPLLRETLQQRFEPYAVPRVIKTVAQIPVSSVGKVNRAQIEK